MGAEIIGLLPEKWQGFGSYFLRKSDFEDFWKTGRDEILTDGTVSEISFCPAGVQRAEPFVQGMQRGGSSMLGLRGKARYRVKGETPCPVIWCLRQVVLGIIWRIVLPKTILSNDRHMKKLLKCKRQIMGRS